MQRGCENEKLPGGFEPPSLDSESRVLTVTPWAPLGAFIARRQANHPAAEPEFKLNFCNKRARGVVVSRLLRMQKALGSNPSGSIIEMAVPSAQ